jgi:polysaccharide deacetylase family protein (PEP-CTERM system associated)
MENVLTIDVEEWYHVCGVGRLPDMRTVEHRVRRTTESLLGLLEACGVTATFFILGSVADRDPELVTLIASSGNEIASHGWSHRLVPELGKEGFRDEVQRTGELLARLSGRWPVGFRAPQWSLGTLTPWAFDILREAECRYDSSLNPLPFVGERRGSLIPYRTSNGMLEFPPLVAPLPGINLPTGGGWGFRFFPRSFVTWSIRKLNDRGYPAILYLHPREMEADGPRVKLSPLRSFAAYGPRSSAADRLKYVLSRYRFTTLERLTESWDTVSSSRHTMPHQPSAP